MSDHFGKVTDWLFRSVAILLLGNSGYQFINGAWFGERIFDGYLEQQSIDVLQRPRSDAPYQDWGFEALHTPLVAEASVWEQVAAVLVLALLVAHVVFKQEVRKSAVSGRRLRAFVKAYVRSYHVVTVSGFFLLVVILLSRRSALTFMIILVLILVGGSLYLILYAADVRRGAFLERLSYCGVLLFTVAALLMWPSTYGRHIFAHRFAVVDVPGLPDADRTQLGRCSPDNFHRGPVLLWHEAASEKEFLRLCQGMRGAGAGRWYLDSFPFDGQHVFLETLSLADILKESVSPVSVKTGEEAVAAARESLERAVP